MAHTLSRREMMMIAAAAAAVTPIGASAQSAAQARTLVDSVVASINAVIASGKS